MMTVIVWLLLTWTTLLAWVHFEKVPVSWLRPKNFLLFLAIWPLALLVMSADLITKIRERNEGGMKFPWGLS